MKTLNMGGVCRASVCLLVIVFVNLQTIDGKPFFTGRFFCDLFCEDYDDDDLNLSTPSTTTGFGDAMEALFDPCTDCPTRRPPTVVPPLGAIMPPGVMPPGAMPPGGMPFFMLPPGFNGMNMTMQMVPNPNSPGSWFMVPGPWQMPVATPNPTQPATTASTTPAPATGTTAGATTAAPTTAAPTTVAPTTAAG